MTDVPAASIAEARPSLLLSTGSDAGLRTLDALRTDLESGPTRQIYRRLLTDAQGDLARPPYVPGSECPNRAPHHVANANRDFVIVDAVARRLKNDALLWLLTDDPRYRDDALGQLEAIFDDAHWPAWPDKAHLVGEREVDLRTGQLLNAIGYMYDWLYDALDERQRRWVVEQLDRRAIAPLLREIERGAWFTQTGFINNWNTVILGGAGIAGMALGSAHERAESFVQRALELMGLYLAELGPDGEFNESVSYAGAMAVPVEFYAAYRYHTRGRVNHLGDQRLVHFARWYMRFILPPGRSARFGDCEAGAPPKASIFSAVASAADDSVLQWFYLHHAKPGKRSDPALELLYYDPSVEPTSPENVVPRGRAFSAHGALWCSRTDWDPDTTAAVVYGKAGHGNECHGHHDAGQLCIDIAGQPMIVDLGHPGPSYPEDFFSPERWAYYNAGVIGHNVLMFDGQEMLGTATEKATAGHTDFHAKVLAADFDDKRGGYWQGDMTDLYRGAQSVRRSVIHLLPAVVAVFDEARLDEAMDISLRWHTADRSEPDAGGRFTVNHDAACLTGWVTRLDGAMRFRRGEHAYRPPFDKARMGPMLEQRRESYVEATCRADRCRVLTLFSGHGPSDAPAAWQKSDAGWTLALPTGSIAVRLRDAEISLQHEREGGWNVPLIPL